MRLNKLAMAAGLALAAVSAAQAAPTLSFSYNGGAAVLCADGAACDSNAAAGIVTFNGAIGAFTVNVTTGLGNGSSPTFLMDLNSVNLQTGAGSNSLVIGFSDTGFTHPGIISGAWGGTVSGSGSISASAYAGVGNALFQNSVLLGALGPFSGGAFAASFNGNSPGGTYSMSQYLTINTSGPFTYSGDFELKVPEPGALALAGMALLAAGLASRRRRV